MKNRRRISTQISLTILLLTSLCINTFAQDWEVLNAPPIYKHHSNGFGIDGKAYIMEGINDDDPNFASNEVWEYIPETDTWTQLDNFPGPSRGLAIGDDWDGKYYYGFGANFGTNQFLNDLWVFDPIAQSFTELPSCPCEGRTHPALVAHNDKIFIGAGGGEDNDLDDWWEYDIATQVWTQKTDIPGGNRHHPFFFSIDNSVYVGGGHVNNWLEYNLATEVWTNIDNYPGGRVAGTQFSYEGMGYLLAGDDINHNTLPFALTFMRYNSLASEWEELPPLPNGSRWAPSSFIIEDDLYFFGGLGNNANDKVMMKFDLSSLDNATSTTNILNEDNLSIFAFPNPVHDKLNFGGEVQTNLSYQIKLLNIRGESVLRMEDFILSNDLDVSALPKGIYILELKNETSSKAIKLVKE